MDASSIATLLSDIGRFINDHTLAAIVISGLTLRGFFDYAEWKIEFGLNWLLRMRRLWVKFKRQWKSADHQNPPASAAATSTQ